MEKVQTVSGEEQRLTMSYEAFLAWSGEDTGAEWVDGEVIVFALPGVRHQEVVGFLLTLLGTYIQFFKLGHLTRSIEMKITPGGSSREPDILFIAEENRSRLTEDRLEGPADLIVEVISTDSVSRDRADKFYEYQEGGVREYWVVDPRPGKERADFWVLDDGGRYHPVPIGDEGVYRATVIPGFWLKVAWLWNAAEQNPQRLFAEIANFPPEVVAALRERAECGPD